MTKLQRAAQAAQETAHSIAYGFAQMVTLGGLEPTRPADDRSDVDAIRSDWDRVGEDMQRAFERVQDDARTR